MKKDPDQDNQRIQRALELLSQEARERVASHPWGHLLGARGGSVDLRFPLPLTARDGELARAGEAVEEALATAVQSLLTHRAVVQPGRVYCLRCRDTACEHAAPAGCRQVFAGFGPSGLPRFVDFPQWLLERGDPRVDRLFQEPPGFLAHTVSGRELTAELLPAYQDREGSFRLHGQVAAGWYPGAGADGHPGVVAVTFQVVSSQPGKSRRRYGLNLVATGPEGEELESFCSRLGTIPWAVPVRWAQSVLEQVGRSRKGDEAARERRIEGLLRSLAGRLEKDRRAQGRRTRHAQRRHAEGDRPTRMALADLARSGTGDVLVDRRRDTLVVVGERGRAHVFNRRGKLVTSIRYTPDSIARRRERGLWRPAREEEVADLKERVGTQAE